MSTTAITGLENAVRDKLGIKFVAARTLVKQAHESLGVPTPCPKEEYDNVFQEAISLFEKLPKKDREGMMAQQNEGEQSSPFIQKAIDQAKRREQARAEADIPEEEREKYRLSDAEDGVEKTKSNTKTETTSSTIIEKKADARPEDMAPHKTYTCYCSIL